MRASTACRCGLSPMPKPDLLRKLADVLVENDTSPRAS
jgi:hypothetical protein